MCEIDDMFVWVPLSPPFKGASKILEVCKSQIPTEQ
jgi:hypothetical protein